MNTDTIALLDKYFDLAVNAPDGIKRLRETILTLAMQGKLVPQDPKDQSASELLKEIEAEKKRLVKEGKIKEPKPIPLIKPEEVPYQLPKGWEWVRLGDIVSITTGKLDANAANANGKFPFFTCSNTPLSIDTYSFDTSAVLLAGNGDFNLKYYSGKFDAYQRTYVIEPLVIDLVFSFLVIKQRIEAITSSFRGSAIPYLRLADITNPLVPLPPLAEQRRIVAKIDELMARVDELELKRDTRNERRLAMHQAAIARLLDAGDANASRSGRDFIFAHFGELYGTKENVAELRKAILQLAVMGRLVPQDLQDQPASELLKEIEAEKKRLAQEGKIKEPKPLPPIKPEEVPYQIPKGWEWVRVDDIGDVKLGRQRSPDNHTGKHMVPYLRVANVYEARIDITDVKEMNFTPSEQAIFRLNDGDVLLNEGQSYELVGRPAIYHNEVPGACFQNTLIRLRPYVKLQASHILLVFRAYMHGGRFQKEVRQTTNIAHLSASRLSMIEFPLPPLAEQKRIVAKVDEMMALCDKLDKQIDERTAKESALLEAVAARV